MQSTVQSRPSGRTGATQEPSPARVSPHAFAWIPTIFGGLVLALSLTGLVLLVLNRGAPKSDRWGFWGFQSLMALLGGATGMLITRRYPRHPIGWMLLGTGLFASLTGISEEFAIYALYTHTDLLPAATLIAGMFNWFWILSYALMAIFIPLLFPNGRFLSPRWRIVAYLGGGWVILGSVWMVVFPGPMPNNGDIENPFGLEALRGLSVASVDPRVGMPFLGMFLMLAAGWSLVMRYRRAQDVTTRQQLKWLAYAAMLMPFAGMIGQVPGFIPNVLVFTLAGAAPLAVAIAVLRYRLYDIDLIINRTLVYGVLTALILGVYALVVAVTGALAQTRGSPTTALLAATLAALLFHPLRSRVQRAVNRLLYGERDAPLSLLSRLGARMEAAVSPEAMLAILTETVAKALKLPYVAVGLDSDGTLMMVATYGKPTDDVIAFPLTYQGQPVGQLLVAPRQPGDAFNQMDVALLENVARQAGAVAHAAQLTADLRRSRQRLVAAREEERRRLRRDLHDDLGPRLASMTLTIDAVVRQLWQNPRQAEKMLHTLKAQSQTAVREIRRLVDDLRPPALDDLGLVAALRELAAQYAHSGVSITVEAPESLPALPAAVEVAAFRIAQEGMTNVVRHANARTCRIVLQPEANCLCVTIEDDGRGLPRPLRMGVGLRSMQERVAELSGRFTVENRGQGGTVVRAWLPMVEAK